MASTVEDELSVRTTVSIPKSDYGEIERIARDKRVSVAWVVREAVAEYLAESEDDKSKPAPRKARK